MDRSSSIRDPSYITHFFCTLPFLLFSYLDYSVLYGENKLFKCQQFFHTHTFFFVLSLCEENEFEFIYKQKSLIILKQISIVTSIRNNILFEEPKHRKHRHIFYIV